MIIVMLQWISLWQKSRYLHSFSSPISQEFCSTRKKPLSRFLIPSWVLDQSYGVSVPLTLLSPKSVFFFAANAHRIFRCGQCKAKFCVAKYVYNICIYDMYLIYVSLGSIGSKSEPQPMWVVTWFHNEKLWWDGNETSIYVGYVNIISASS